MNKFLVFLFIVASTLFGVFLFAGKTEAISNQFLNPAPFPGGNGTGSNLISAVVEYADAVSIPDINLKWFIPTGYAGNPDIILRNFCAADRHDAYMHIAVFNELTGDWDAAGLDLINWLPVANPAVEANLCVGNDLVVSGVANSNFRTQRNGPPWGPAGPDRYPGFRVLLINIHLRHPRSGGEINKFNVEVSPGTTISHAELPESLAQAPGQPAGGGFAILGNYPAAGNVYGYNASFSFKPSCSIFTPANPSVAPAYLHWRDGDAWASYGYGTYWQLIRTSDNFVVAQRGPEGGPTADSLANPAALGGASDQHKSALVNLQINENYEWRWRNINHLNTIHIWMSFSEMNTLTPDCPEPLPPQCAITDIFRLGTNDPLIQPGDPIQFTLSVSNANGYTLGVNGPTADPLHPNDPAWGAKGNYLVSGSNYVRGPTVNSNNYTVVVNAITNVDGGPLNQQMIAPPAGTGIPFNWGFVMAGVGWLPVTCAQTISSIPPVVFECSVELLPTGPYFEVAERFALRINIDNQSAVGAPNMTDATHPVTVTSNPAVTGLSLPYVYNAPPRTSTNYVPGAAGDTDIYSNAPGYYVFTVTIRDVRTGAVTNCNGPAVTIGNKSYLKAYGGDVWAGGGFSPSCSAANGAGDIYGFARSAGAGPSGGTDYAGASAQLTVTALLTINDFYSVNTRVPNIGNTFAPRGLTFANTGAAPYGGGFGGGGRCITDYWGSTQEPNLQDVGAFSGGSAAPFTVGRHQYVNPNPLTINSAGAAITVPRGAQNAIFVNGNVQINDNILFDTSARANNEEIPYLVIVARGNIYIDNDVSRIDAVLVAQGGTIYTCTDNTTQNNSLLYTTAQLYGACSGAGRQLTINGALIAQRVKFQRVFGTLAGAGAREMPNFGTGQAAAGSPINAAEIINYTPELYLAPSPLKRPSEAYDGAESGAYQAISGLPPIY